MEQPEGDLTRDQIIDYYIKTLAQVVGSEEEARMKIYSVSHRCYFAFGAFVSEDLSHKIKELPKVKWVLPDSYLDVKNKDYGGEPFIDGKAVPYDPKYHEEWIRNNARAADRNRRNDRPRNSDRSRNFERRRENVGGQDTGYRGPPPNKGMGGAAPPNMNQTYRGPPPPPNMGQNYQGTPPPPNMNQNYQGSPPQLNMNQNYQGPPPSNMGQNYRGPPPPPPSMSQNYQGPPPPNVNGGWSGNYQQNGGYQQGQHGGMQQQSYPPNRDQ